MERFDIYKDISERTGGDIYIGVVGPVRTGKSTFIKKFMSLLVIPNIEDEYDRGRALDELPQSGAGKTIMTSEPKFVPSDAIEIGLKDNVKIRVRLVDCVGYTVKGAVGYEDDNGPRMVTTPWHEEQIPFEQAAEEGTKKVITEHSTIGLVVTTDGSIAEIPRGNYVKAEERVIKELKDLGKPFIIILNSTHPLEKSTQELAVNLTEKYDVPVVPCDCMNLTQKDIEGILEEVLFEFPIMEINFKLPPWIRELEEGYWARVEYEEMVRNAVKEIQRIRDLENVVGRMNDHENVEEANLECISLGEGIANVNLIAPKGLYYKVLAEICGYEVTDEGCLLSLIRDFSAAKREHDKVKDALEQVFKNGYGIVPPKLEELTLEEPELIRQGKNFGVRLKASAPSLHIIRADITAEVTPIVGTEKQGEEMVRYLTETFEKDPTRIWQSEFLGRPLNDLVRESIQSKLHHMPENAQIKLQETLQKIVNEGSGGLICIIL
jgi:stage IV sporulation protein A